MQRPPSVLLSSDSLELWRFLHKLVAGVEQEAVGMGYSPSRSKFWLVARPGGQARVTALAVFRRLQPSLRTQKFDLLILYNSCSVVVSVLVWTIIRKALVAGQPCAFWLMLFVTGFIEVMAFIASAEVGHVRWQVNVIQSILYAVDICITGYALFKP